MKRILTTLVLFIVLTTIIFAGGQSDKTQKAEYTVGISKLLAHPALDSAEQGMIDYLSSKGLSIAFDRQNANGDISTASSIAQKFKSDKVSVAVGIATLPLRRSPRSSVPIKAPSSSAPLPILRKQVSWRRISPASATRTPLKNRSNFSWISPERSESETSMHQAKPTVWS